MNDKVTLLPLQVDLDVAFSKGDVIVTNLRCPRFPKTNQFHIETTKKQAKVRLVFTELISPLQ